MPFRLGARTRALGDCMDRDLLKGEVTRARGVFDRHSNEISEAFFSSFPRGCCGNASLFLGNWLSHVGFKDIKVVLAENDAGDSHSWLALKDCIVDITADQFEDQGYGIYPIGSEYHNSYSDQTEDSLAVHDALVEPFEKFMQLMNNSREKD